MDLASASASDNKIAWYENTNGDGLVWQGTVTTDAAGAYSVYIADIDTGKMDLASASTTARLRGTKEAAQPASHIPWRKLGGTLVEHS